MIRTPHAMIVLLAICACCATAGAQHPPASPDDLHLSESVRVLLQREMREIAGGSQALPMYLAAGDWKSIQHVSEQIRDSYILAQELSESQRQELETGLPERFKRLDMEFHARANKLGLAAASQDPEIVAYHYHRLLETCVTCHAAYARERFPGLSADSTGDHGH